MGTEAINPPPCSSAEHPGDLAVGEVLLWLDGEDHWRWFPYCEKCLMVLEDGGSEARRWDKKVAVVQKEWRVRSANGEWPEIFQRRENAESDLAYCRDAYRDTTWWMESREVGEWTK